MNHPSKCAHSVYWPANDPVNLGCQICNPAGLGESPAPIMPRSSSDALTQKMVAVTNCKGCGNVRTYCTDSCRVCGTPFPAADLRGHDGPSNKKQAGGCSACGSTIHYETDKKNLWECAECGETYRAPKAGDDVE